MTSSQKTVNIGKVFSKFPAGRYSADGPASGEKFREDVLRPILSAGFDLVIELDDALGYGSSFLEEAFGGLVRSGFGANELLRRCHFESYDDSLVEEIRSYIREAGA